MKAFKLGAAAAAVVGVLGLTGCGGGDSGAAGGTSGERISSGIITGFGSVYVNGIKYETDGASISLDGRSVAEAELGVGMVVTLQGTVNADGTTGRAVSIRYVDELEGTVLSNAIPEGATSGSLVVMGQTVHVGSETVFESKNSAAASIDQVAPGHWVEVSGHTLGNGEIAATRLEVKAPGQVGEMEVKGLVADLDSTAQTFRLGSLRVDYDNAIVEVPAGILSEGLFVEVKSSTPPQPDGDGGYLLAATKVELEGDGRRGVWGGAGEDVELLGVISDVTAMPDSFVLNGQRILAGSALFKDGASAATLRAGDRVKVEGRFNAEGDLVAEKVEGRQGSVGEIEFEAPLEAVGTGSVTLLGRTIGVTATTLFRDRRDEERRFNLSDLIPGDFLEVKAHRSGDGETLVAARLERTRADDRVKVEGRVTVVDAQTITVEGVSFAGSAAQLSGWAVGDRVEVKARLNGTAALTIDEIESGS